MNSIRILLIATGILGAVVFSAACAASFLNPGWVEKIGRDILRHQVEKKAHEKIDAIDADFLSKKAGHFIRDYEDRLAQARRQLEHGLPEKIARVIAEMRHLDCECRKKIETNIRDGYLSRIMDTAQMQERLNTLIRTRYMEAANQLMREFRIFTGSNAAVFALLAIAGLVRKKAGVHLLPSATVLLAAAGVTAFLYLFNQNWLHTLVFSDYLGWGYLVYLSVALAFLSDVIFNRARVTCEVLGSVGSGVTIAPC